MKKLMLCFCLLLAGCVGVPDNVQPIKDFTLNSYLGKWYEIARLEHSFEKGLSRVTADYSVRPDGGVNVLNRGFSAKENKWKEAVGKGYFVSTPDVAHLKVSFFGPFYASYIVFELDENYRYALVCGQNKSYLWILAREPRLDRSIIDKLTAKAKAAGFDTERLVFVYQD